MGNKMIIVIFYYKQNYKNHFLSRLATVIVPQNQRNDHSLFLWNHKHLDFPVHSFFGHKDVILEFGWRKTPDDNLEMVTFSRDHTLR